MYINPVVLGKRTLGSISCNTTTSRPLRLIPSTECLWSNSRTQTLHKAIAPHWSSSYPEYLSSNQDPEEQRRVVWSRLHSHQANLASRLKKQKERYLALRHKLNPRTTQAESSHVPLLRDTVLGGGAPLPLNFLGRVSSRSPGVVSSSYGGWLEGNSSSWVVPRDFPLCYGTTWERLLYGYD